MAKENVDVYAVQLGKLMGNFLTLEFILRAILSKLPDALPPAVPWGTDVYTYAVGTELPISDMTSAESLSDLIYRFNTANDKFRLGESIDPALGDFRNALAHGRYSAHQFGHRIRLLKFDRPDKKTKKVRISYNEEMTDEWFAQNNEHIRGAIFDAAKVDHEVELRWPPRPDGYSA